MAFLFASAAVTAITAAAPAFAQGPAPTTATSQGTIEEVVVTATRTTSTVNRVPLSISAETQATLDQEGVKTIADLQRIVPSLSVSGGVGGVQNFSIRGVASSQGAATTGVYLDDVALQKRFAAGPTGSGTTTGNGSPAPPLFDLERVEVLRGPQGTLYGGSSEGGTVRFITPAPSLTTYSGLGRAEVNTVKDGGVGGEVGVAVGGPIIQDKLGFRLSVFDRYTAGYIDVVNPYTGGTILDKDANAETTFSAHGAVLWAPTSQFKVTASLYGSDIKDQGGPNQWTLPIGGTFTTPASCYNTTSQFGQTPAPTTAVACPANAVAGHTVGGIYERPSQTYGPFNYLGRDKALGVALAPVETKTYVASLTLDYDFGWVMAKSITAYLYDNTSANNGVGATTSLANVQSTTAYPGAKGFPLFSPVPGYAGSIVSDNRRSGITEELRFSSRPDSGPLSWVGGLYFSRIHNRAGYVLTGDFNSLQDGPLYGITAQQQYGVPQIGSNDVRSEILNDSEYAVFGEGNYKVTDKLTLIAGVRVSRVSFDFNQAQYGISLGYNTPTLANLGLAQGQATATPVTPKFGLEYKFTPTQILYATAAEGFRAGGVNTPLNASLCNAGLAAAGLTTADIPTTYGPDTVWSYEAGGKFRLLGGRLQVNSSIYDIDWKNVQLTVSGVAGCPGSWVQNAGEATSRGFDLETQAKLFGGLSADASAGYTDAHYTETVRAPAPAGVLGAPIVRQGDPLPVPGWQANLGLRYDVRMWDRYGAYVRADYFFQGAYQRSPGAGVTQFAPDTYQAPATRQVNVRAGVGFRGWDFNAYVNNLLDSQDQLTEGSYGATTTGGRSGCALAQGAACTTFTGYNPFLATGTLRPREMGVQANYRF